MPKGVRTVDGAEIELDDPRPTETGYVATNPSDGTQYYIGRRSLIILAGDDVLAQEPMIEYYAY